jgi:hypothetical protein
LGRASPDSLSERGGAGGGVVVGKKTRLELEVEAIKQF